MPWRYCGSRSPPRHFARPAIPAAARSCATALAMFHGEVLPDGGDGAWLAPHRSRLEEARLRLTEDHLAARIALGAAGQVIGELETLVAAHPLREGLWRLLITALYQTGRQADALAAYRRIQRLLDDELGLDPGVELQALEAQILRQDAALTLPTSVAGPDRSLVVVGRAGRRHLGGEPARSASTG